MFGSGLGSLAVLLDSEAVWLLVRPASSPRDLWHRAQVTLAPRPGTQASIAIEASKHQIFLSREPKYFSPGECGGDWARRHRAGHGAAGGGALRPPAGLRRPGLAHPRLLLQRGHVRLPGAGEGGYIQGIQYSL